MSQSRFSARFSEKTAIIVRLRKRSGSPLLSGVTTSLALKPLCPIRSLAAKFEVFDHANCAIVLYGPGISWVLDVLESRRLAYRKLTKTQLEVTAWTAAPGFLRTSR